MDGELVVDPGAERKAGTRRFGVVELATAAWVKDDWGMIDCRAEIRDEGGTCGARRMGGCGSEEEKIG